MLIYILKLNFKINYINIEIEKIIGSIIKTFKIVMDSFQ